MSEINLPPDLPVTEARTIRRALRLLEISAPAREQFNSTTFTKTRLQLRLALQEREVFLVLYLDNQNRLLECETLFTGTINHTEVHPREVVKLALRHNAAAVILAHNHPSGETEPSKQDRNITQHLVNALAMVEVRVLDHLIVGIDVLSFAERGWL